MIYQFSNFSLDVDRQELRRGMNLIDVEPQVLDLLQYLIRNRGRVVSKDDLITSVWKGRVVSDSTLSSRISSARRAIGDNGDNQQIIKTIARKGIRFVGEVLENQNAVLASAASRQEGEREPSIQASHEEATLRLPDKPSIAVMPFTNMSGDPEQEYFSDGVTEDIITALSRLRWFFVIARNSTFVYKGQSVDLRQVGHHLGVRYILEGSVRKNGQQVRITGQLTDAVAANHIWAERYDRELNDIFSLQDEITASVTAAIEPKLLAAEGRRVETRPINDLDAWGLVARALSHFWKLSPAQSETAIAILRQAVDRHPDYAPAHSLLAFALLVAAHMGWLSTGNHRELAERLAQRALELDEHDPWAHMALGNLAFTARKTDEAVHRFRTAIELNPNFAAAHGYTGWVLAHDGQSDEAISHLQQAIRMSPRDPFNVFFMAGMAAAHYVAGRYAEAVKWAQQALQLRPGHLGARRKLCASLAQAGRVEEAKSAMSQLREMQPNLSIGWIEQSVPYTSGPMKHFLEGLRKAGLND
jgi:TolB-like protein/cytochrome c-type biogenesis protein CcmH/NrfG